jgi:hypothetical protein
MMEICMVLLELVAFVNKLEIWTFLILLVTLRCSL